jgi:hypothetical protein
MPFKPEKLKKKNSNNIELKIEYYHELEIQFAEGIKLLQQNKITTAKEIFNQILLINPNHFASLHVLGIIAANRNQHLLALELIEKAITINPNNAQALCHYGDSLEVLNRFEEAISSYSIAILSSPNFAEAYYKKGATFNKIFKYREAILNFDKVIELKPEHAKAHNGRGIALLGLKQFNEALLFITKSIELDSNFPDAYNNRGIVLVELQKFNEALISFNQAIELQPNHLEAHINQGNLLLELRDLEAACNSYDNATKIKSNKAEAIWGKSVALLLNGEYKKGFELYESRWGKDDIAIHKRNFEQPSLLNAVEIYGKTIFIYAEQGLGDTIQFCRYSILLKDRGARVILEVPKALMGLLSSLQGVDTLLEKGKCIPKFDYHCPLLSLPLAFKTDKETIPHFTKYLFANKDKVNKWEKILGAKVIKRIGLVWSGSTIHKNDHNRSFSLQHLLPHLPNDYRYVCLQKELREIDKNCLNNSNIEFYGDFLDDFTDTSALCELMDIVITVDTSVAHLAGAMGKTTWILLPYVPDWRWLLDGENSDWYKTVKLYRQGKDRDWHPVLTHVAKDLQAYFRTTA